MQMDWSLLMLCSDSPGHGEAAPWAAASPASPVSPVPPISPASPAPPPSPASPISPASPAFPASLDLVSYSSETECTAHPAPEQQHLVLLSGLGASFSTTSFNCTHIHLVTPAFIPRISTEIIISHQTPYTIFCLNLDRLAPLLLSVFLLKLY